MATMPASRNAATEGLDKPKEEKTKNQEGLVLSKMKTKKENENEKKTRKKKYETHPSSGIDIGISRSIHPEG